MQTPEEVWSEIEDGFDSVTQWGISDDQRARVAALIRERDAEVRADERAKVLAGFEWEMTDRAMPKVVPCDCKHPQHARLVGDDSPPTHVSFDFVPHRRLVGPWEPTP